MTNRQVLIAGATGLVGRELLAGLLADPTVAAVHTLGRRPPAATHTKLQAHVVDFAALPTLPAADECYLALGTTIKVAGSQAAFKAIDFDANLNVARAAQAAGVQRIGLVSAMGANAASAVFYSRVKGELEDALAALGFAGLVIARPALLVGAREALGQPVRPGEQLGSAVGWLLGWAMPANYRPIDAVAVAQALRRRVPVVRGLEVLPSGELRRLADGG